MRVPSQRFDARRYPARGADPFAAIDLTEMLAGVPRIMAMPRQTQFSDFLDDAAGGVQPGHGEITNRVQRLVMGLAESGMRESAGWFGLC